MKLGGKELKFKKLKQKTTKINIKNYGAQKLIKELLQRVKDHISLQMLKWIL